MRHAVSAFCCFIVGLQVLIGVPLAVCCAFFFLVTGGAGPVAVELHAGRDFPPPATVPPPNFIPPVVSLPNDNPILTSRAQHGSPLAGTILAENTDGENEQELFVAAFEKIAAQQAAAGPQIPAIAEPPANVVSPSSAAGNESQPTPLRQKADEFAVRHLYAMANSDELAGQFDRADQWRFLAREIRAPQAADDSALPAIGEPLSPLPLPADSAP